MHGFIVFDLIKGRAGPSLKTLTKDKKLSETEFLEFKNLPNFLEVQCVKLVSQQQF
jgi:hypothetical protein